MEMALQKQKVGDIQTGLESNVDFSSFSTEACSWQHSH